jgi:hypothetical protein
VRSVLQQRGLDIHGWYLSCDYGSSCVLSWEVVLGTESLCVVLLSNARFISEQYIVILYDLYYYILFKQESSRLPSLRVSIQNQKYAGPPQSDLYFGSA